MRNLCIITTCFPDVNNEYYGGMFIKRELEELYKYFNNVYVIVPTAYKTKEDKYCFDYNYKNVKVFFPRYLHIPINIFRKMSGTTHTKIVDKVIEENNLKIDIIYSHVMWQSGYAATKLKEKYNVPVIVVGHGTDVRKPLTTSERWLRYKLDYTMKNADTVLVNHEELEEMLLNYYQEYGNKIKFNYKGINLKKFTGKKTVDKKDFVVLFVGNLNNFKDPLTFIEAAKILIYSGVDNITFKMVGVGPLSDKCYELINDYDLKHCVRMCGPSEKVEDYFNNCDVFCALSPIENIWSTTLQEALCSNKPCVVTDVGHSRKILTHLKDSYLVSKENPEELASAIIQLKNNNKLYYKLSNTKWKKIFDIRKTTKKLYSILRRTKCR